MTRSCYDCEHSEHVYDKKDCTHTRVCVSPQVRASQRWKARCIFERDTYPDHNRDKPGHEKCGPDGRNFKQREAE